MKIQPRSHNAVTIILENGDEFDLHTSHDNGLILTRPQQDKRNYRIELANTDSADWTYAAAHWMIRLTKED